MLGILVLLLHQCSRPDHIPAHHPAKHPLHLPMALYQKQPGLVLQYKLSRSAASVWTKSPVWHSCLVVTCVVVMSAVLSLYVPCAVHLSSILSDSSSRRTHELNWFSAFYRLIYSVHDHFWEFIFYGTVHKFEVIQNFEFSDFLPSLCQFLLADWLRWQSAC